MATILKSLVQATGIASGAGTALNHNLVIEEVGIIPDKVTLSNPSFAVLSATATQVTIRNDGQVAADCDVLCEHWFSAERVISGTALAVQPFVPNSAGAANIQDPFGIFGNGALGDVVAVGDINIAGDACYDSLDTAGFDVYVNSLRLFVRNTLTIRAGSHIYSNGAAAAAGTGGAARLAQLVSGTIGGGNGGNAAGTAGTVSAYSLGGSGGAGGAGTGGAGGAGGAATDLPASETQPIMLPEAVTMRSTGRFLGPGYDYMMGGASGGGGGGSGAAPGGGGGAGGGIVMVAARTLVMEAGSFIQAIGGDGADGTVADAGGGGGGGGGGISVVYRRATLAGTISAPGGAGGASGGGAGVAGTAGAAGRVFQLQV